MTNLIDLDAFLMRALTQRAKQGQQSAGVLRSASAALALAERCQAKVIVTNFACHPAG